MTASLAGLQRPDAAVDATPRLPVDRVQQFDTPEFAGMRFLEVTTKSALNKVRGMPFGWSINPYRGCSHACSYCFARPTHSYLNLSPFEDFEKAVVVKTNLVAVLRAELARPSWRGEHVALGTNTDPYQRAEGRYRLMPGVIDALARSRTPFSILTKGTLLTRDTDALVDAATKVEVAAALTVGMLDDALWRSAEPGTPSPRARLDAVARLAAAGIPTGVMLAPIMPGLNDDEEQLAELVDRAVAAGAAHVTPTVLHLRPAVRAVFWPWLEATHPELVDHYRDLYPEGGRSGQAPPGYRERIEGFVHARRSEAWRRHGRPPPPRSWRGRRGDERSTITADPVATRRPHPRTERGPAQLSLLP